MSLGRICDKCEKVFEGDVSHVDSNVDEVPDFIVSLGGKVILQYKDLCDPCKAKCSGNTEKYLAVKSRQVSAPSDKITEK